MYFYPTHENRHFYKKYFIDKCLSLKLIYLYIHLYTNLHNILFVLIRTYKRIPVYSFKLSLYILNITETIFKKLHTQLDRCWNNDTNNLQSPGWI